MPVASSPLSIPCHGDFVTEKSLFLNFLYQIYGISQMQEEACRRPPYPSLSGMESVFELFRYGSNGIDLIAIAHMLLVFCEP